MKTHRSRKPDWPRKVTVGREHVSIYKRTAPNGSTCFMVANYADGKRRFDSYAYEALALEAAGKLARQMSEREVLAAAMTNEQASEFAAAVQRIAPFKVGLLSVADAVANALKILGGFENMDKVREAAAQGKSLPALSEFLAAAKFYYERHKKITAKRVADVVTELISHKKARKKSERYLRDLNSRLNRFAETFQKNVGDVTTPELQSWLDDMKLSARSVKNYRAALEMLFTFAESRGYVAKGCNPVDDTEKVAGVSAGAIEIFKPKEITALLNHAPRKYLPLVALGAFAGLRTAEAERLEWSDIDFEGGFIHIAGEKAKTRSRRLVPILPNLRAWLIPYAKKTGKVWADSERERKRLRNKMLKASGVKWKDNGLRHSFCSYRLAVTHDAAKTSLEAGNSPQMIFQHYRELVKPADALEWFSVLPEGEPAPVVTKKIPIVNRRQPLPHVARMPKEGTVAAN